MFFGKKVRLLSKNSRKIRVLQYLLVKGKDTRLKNLFIAFEENSLVRKTIFKVSIFHTVCL